jgi:hypothetical protein
MLMTEFGSVTSCHTPRAPRLRRARPAPRRAAHFRTHSHLLAFDIAIVIVTFLSVDWRRSLGSFGIPIFIFIVFSKQAHVVADDVVTSSDIAYISHILDGISSNIEHLLIKFHTGRDEYIVVGSRQQQMIRSVTDVILVSSEYCFVVQLLGM